jgi:hypothetical protein
MSIAKITFYYIQHQGIENAGKNHSEQLRIHILDKHHVLGSGDLMAFQYRVKCDLWIETGLRLTSHRSVIYVTAGCIPGLFRDRGLREVRSRWAAIEMQFATSPDQRCSFSASEVIYLAQCETLRHAGDRLAMFAEP